MLLQGRSILSGPVGGLTMAGVCAERPVRLYTDLFEGTAMDGTNLSIMYSLLTF